MIRKRSELGACLLDGWEAEFEAGLEGSGGDHPLTLGDHGGPLLPKHEVPDRLRQRDEGGPPQSSGEGVDELLVGDYLKNQKVVVNI